MSQFEQGVQGGSMALSNADIKPVSIPKIGNVNLVNANQEYSYVIPDNTRRILFCLQELDSTVRLSFYFESAAADIMTFDGDAIISEGNVLLVSQTLYVKSDTPGKVVQVLSWE